MSPDSRMYQMLFNHIGQIKWQWRALAFFILSLLLSNFIAVLYGLYLPKESASIAQDLATLIRFAGWLFGTVFVTWFLLARLDKRPWNSIGLSLHPEWKKEFSFGVLLGILMPLVLFILLWPWGFITVSVRPVEWLDFFLDLAVNTCVWFTAALWTELLLRGYFLQTMSEGMGKIVAAVFVSLMYALIRIQFHPDQIITAINTAAFGFIFAICYFRTRALWTGIGMQFALMMVQNFVFGVPLYGVRPFYSLLEISTSGRNVAVGNYFGLEQGLVATLILLSTLYYLVRSKQLSVSEEVRKIKFEALSRPFFTVKK